MTDKEILQKTIEKAKNNQYLIPVVLSEIFKGIEDKGRNRKYEWRITKIEDFLYFDNHGRVEEETLILSVNDIVFSHDFCKAFWRNDVEYFCPNHNNVSTDLSYGDTCGYCQSEYVKIWKYHLQSMVLEKNPLKYLEKFL